jgi:hypothetical protein
MATGGLFYSRDDTDAVEETQLRYSNPHRQRVGPRWVRGEVVFAMPLGIVNVDPTSTRWAKEYVVVYSVDGGPEGRPERVPGQYGIQARRRELQPHLALQLCRRRARLRAEHASV